MGVTLRQQQVWQIESGTPRRRLSVGEAQAFARVFEISLTTLMTPPAEDFPLQLVQLSSEFRDWRLAEGSQAIQLAEIARRVDELNKGEQFTADSVARYSALSADHAIADLTMIIENLQYVLDEIRKGGSAWQVVASAVDLTPPPEDRNADGAH